MGCRCVSVCLCVRTPAQCEPTFHVHPLAVRDFWGSGSAPAEGGGSNVAWIPVWMGSHVVHSLLAIALQLSQAGEEQSTCPFPNNGPTSAQEARSDLFSLLCPLWPVIKGPSHCLNHFHDSGNSILRSGGRDLQPAQSRRHCSRGQRPRQAAWRGGGAWEKEGECWLCLSPPCPLRWQQ